MDSLADDWTPRPILYLDLNTGNYSSYDSLTHIINDTLTNWEALYGSAPSEVTPELRFKGIVRRACRQTGHRVVILVDEYDKPMLQAIGNEQLQEAYRDTLKAFYGGDIKFAMLTGVTKFGKVSVFSDLNNLMDISMDARYHDICGVSRQELLENFREDISELARAQGMTDGECEEELRRMYDGYHFKENTPGMYNPFSLLNTFAKGEFGSYWFETGTPSYLVKLLKLHKYELNEMASMVTSEDVLNSIDAASTDPIPVIYQSGYLTIKGYDRRFKNYTLGFPNEEVEKGFVKYLMPFYTPVSESKSAFEISNFVREVESGDTDAFFTRLRGFFADIPYELQRDIEVHYQNVLFIVFRLMGFYTEVEYRTAAGRADLVLKTDRYIYVMEFKLNGTAEQMEFKLNGTAEQAIAQINSKGYAEPFAADRRKVIKVGVGFSKTEKTIESWIVQ